MNLKQLIEAAAFKRNGQANLAKEIGRGATTITEWKAKRRRPETSEIAYMAEIAGVPVIETVIEIEAELATKYSNSLSRALDNWCAQRDSNARPLPSEGNTLSS